MTEGLRTPALGLRIDGVDLSYGDSHILKGIDLDIRPGEFFAFLGPSGCGKTTLLRLIAGFASADRGRVLIGGKDVSRLPPWKRDVGLVFQSYALWPHMSVARNVAFGLEERRLPRAEIARRVAAALDLVGLGPLAARRPSQLSGGQQQRVALARTIAVEPKLLLLDEPLSNLDAALRVQVRGELKEMQQRLGITTIFVTHDQEEANAVCDRVAIMNDGVVQQVGRPQDVYENPANLFVAGFLGAANILNGVLQNGSAGRSYVIAPGFTLPVPDDLAITPASRLVIRPQDIILGPPDASPADAVPAKVLDSEFAGATIRYRVRVNDVILRSEQPFTAGRDRLANGDAVCLTVDPGALRWILSERPA